MPSDAPSQETSSSGQAAAVADELDRTSFEPGHPPRITPGPFILLVTGALLELLSRLVPNTVGPREVMEQTTSLAAFSLMAGAAFWVIRQLGNIPHATRLVAVAACLVMVSQTLIVTDQIPRLDRVPVLGRYGFFHEPMENLPFPVGVVLLLAGFLYAALEAQRARHRLILEHQEVRKEFAERRRAEEALRATERRYRFLAENITDTICTMDLDLRVSYISPSVRYLLGYSVEELTGTSLHRIMAPASFDAVKKVLAEELLTDAEQDSDPFRSRTIEIELTTKSGARILTEAKARFLRAPNGRITEILAVVRDITARKEMEDALRKSHDELQDRIKERTAELERANEALVAEIGERKRALAALRQSEQEFRLMADSVPALFAYVGADGRYLFANKRYEEWFGLARTEIVGKHYREVLGEDTYEMIRGHVEAALSGQRVGYEAALPYVHGGVRWVLADYLPYADDSGQIKGFFALVTDITERKLVEERIRTALKEKEVLLKEVQHRVKNNLQVISSLFDLQSRSTDDERVLAMFKESRDRVRSIALIHEKLYEADDLTRIDFREYIGSLATHLFRSYGVNFDAIKLTTYFDDVALSIDAAIPCALIVNELISNALKHAFPGGNRGEIRVELRCGNDGDVILVVGDNGVGLPEGLNIREPTSLGLRLVGTLTRQLKGRIEVERDGGTTFSVTFPAGSLQTGVG